MIQVSDITLRQGAFELLGVSFQIPTGAYGILMGKTGAGKTSLLECVVGFRKVSRGKILLHGRDVTKLNPAVRGIGYVPQDAALFPRMKIREQLAFALTIRGLKRTLRERRVEELADLLGISHLLDRRPTRLSGGERQRVALGRALSFSPGVLCLDEPLSALDTQTRTQMCDLLRKVQHTTGVTTLHITHNETEAVQLGDIVLMVEDGQVQVVDQPAPSSKDHGASAKETRIAGQTPR